MVASLPGDDDRRHSVEGHDEGPGGRTEIGKRLPGSKLEDEIRDIRDNNRTIGNEDGGFRPPGRLP